MIHTHLILGFADSLSANSMFFLITAVGLALAFEFVNGFHDTANAVATVIYTHTLPPYVAVIWSGLCNLSGVLVSSGTVAFAILALLPVELIVNVGSGPGFAMIFALLISAIMWNVGTWYLGLPASSSHTLIGSILGVGLANALMTGPHDGGRHQLVAGRKSVPLLARVPNRRFCRSGCTAPSTQSSGSESCAVSTAAQRSPAALVDSRHAYADLHRRELRSRVE